MLPLIARTLQGLETQMAAVRAVSLAAPARPAIDEAVADALAADDG